MELPFAVIACVLAVFATYFAWRAGCISAPVPQADPEKPPPETTPEAKEAEDTPETEKQKDIHAIAIDLDDAWNKAPTLESVRGSALFREAVAAISALDLPEANLFGYARRGDGLVAVLALEALAKRPATDAASLRSPVWFMREFATTGGSTRISHTFRITCVSHWQS